MASSRMTLGRNKHIWNCSAPKMVGTVLPSWPFELATRAHKLITRSVRTIDIFSKQLQTLGKSFNPGSQVFLPWFCCLIFAAVRCPFCLGEHSASMKLSAQSSVQACSQVLPVPKHGLLGLSA